MHGIITEAVTTAVGSINWLTIGAIIAVNFALGLVTDSKLVGEASVIVTILVASHVIGFGFVAGVMTYFAAQVIVMILAKLFGGD